MKRELNSSVLTVCLVIAHSTDRQTDRDRDRVAQCATRCSMFRVSNELHGNSLLRLVVGR
jgi:tellurite resistance protein